VRSRGALSVVLLLAAAVGGGAGRVGKGTVYLHWTSRRSLFQAVLAREVTAAVEDLVAALAVDPEAWRPHRLVQVYFLAIRRRPLLMALALADTEVLGDLALPDEDGEDVAHSVVSTTYFARLAQDGLLAQDVTPAAAAYAFAAVLEGFLRAEGGHEPALSDEHARAVLLAHIVRTGLESGRAPTPRQETALRIDVPRILTRLLDPDGSTPHGSPPPGSTPGTEEAPR